MGTTPSSSLFQDDTEGEATTPAGQNAGEQPTQGPEAPVTPTGPGQQRQTHGPGPLYAIRSSHDGFPRRSMPRLNTSGAAGRSGVAAASGSSHGGGPPRGTPRYDDSSDSPNPYLRGGPPRGSPPRYDESYDSPSPDRSGGPLAGWDHYDYSSDSQGPDLRGSPPLGGSRHNDSSNSPSPEFRGGPPRGPPRYDDSSDSPAPDRSGDPPRGSPPSYDGSYDSPSPDRSGGPLGGGDPDDYSSDSPSPDGGGPPAGISPPLNPDRRAESIYSETTEPDDNMEQLTGHGFLLSITGRGEGERVRFCIRLDGEGEPFRQGYEIAKWISARGKADALRVGFRHIQRDLVENRQTATLPASAVLQRIADSRPRRPFIYRDEYDDAPWLNAVWAYRIDLQAERLSIYGPPSLARHEVPEGDFYHRAFASRPAGGQIPRRIMAHTFDQLSEFRSPQVFRSSVYNGFSERARGQYSLPERTPDVDAPTELDNAHGDARSPSVTTPPTVVYVISSSEPPSSSSPEPPSSSTPEPPSSPDERGDQPRLASPTRFTRPFPRHRSSQNRAPTPGPGRSPLLYPSSASDTEEQRRPNPAWARFRDPQAPPPQARPFDPATSSSPIQDQSDSPHAPENRPIYNRNGSPWQPGDTPPPGSDPSLDYGQPRGGSGDSTGAEAENRPSADDFRAPRAPIVHRKLSSPLTPPDGVILRVLSGENSSPIRGPPQPDEPHTPPWHWWRPPPHHPSRSSSPMDVSREPRGDDDGSPTLNVRAARRRAEKLQRTSSPELPPLRRSPPLNPDVRPEEPIESGASDNGSDNFDDSPIRAKRGSKRRREVQDQSDRSNDEAGDSMSEETSSSPVKKRRRDDESDGAESGGQAKPGLQGSESDLPDYESDLPDYESDSKSPLPTANRPHDTLTEYDLPDMEPDCEASDPSAKRQGRDGSWDRSSNRSSGSAYADHWASPEARISLELTAIDLGESHMQLNDQYAPAPGWQNEQVIFRSPQWNTSSLRATSDEESPKSKRNSPQSFSSSPGDNPPQGAVTMPARGQGEPADGGSPLFDDDPDHLWRRSWPGGVRGGPTSNNMYQAAPEGVEDIHDEDEQNGRSGSWPGARPGRPVAEGYAPAYTYDDEPGHVDPEYGQQEEDSDTFVSLGSIPPSDWDATQDLSEALQ